MRNGIFITKPVELLAREAVDSGEGLRRALGPIELTALGIGAVIGAGIFVLTGHAAAEHAGPAIVLSFILSGVACAFAGLCYAEMASMIPIAGSAYTYAYATIGELFAWIIGWDLILEYLFGGVTVAIGWSGYVISFLRDLGIVFPPALSAAPGKIVTLPDGSQVTAVFNLPAVFIIAAVTALLIIGVKESAFVNNIIVILKVAILLLFIAAGMGFIDTTNWRPFIPPNTGTFGEFGASGILRGAGVIFFAYIGFDSGARSAEPTERYASRHSWQSPALYDSLYRRRARSDWHCSLFATRRSRSSGGRRRRYWLDLARSDCQNRRDRRPQLGHSGPPHEPTAHLLVDVARRAVAQNFQPSAPAIPYSPSYDSRHRADRRGVRGRPTD